MKLSEDIKPITYLKTRAAELINTISTRRSPVVITQNGEAKAVVQDIRSYERDRSALLMLKLLAQGILVLSSPKQVLTMMAKLKNQKR